VATLNSARPAYIITGPTSGYGYRTAQKLAGHGPLILVGRNPGKLDEVSKTIEGQGGHAVPVVCDLSDPVAAGCAAAEIAALGLPLAALVNNAGIMQVHPTQNAQGWDMTFATDHLGPFALTEALIPHLPDGATVVTVCSAVEDPARRQARASGFRGGRYISAAASARGEWQAGGSSRAGLDAYATSKQCALATILAFARETPRLRFNAVEPGFSPATGLSRDAGPFVQFLTKYAMAPLVRLIPGSTTPDRAATVISGAALNPSGVSGAYYDEKSTPMTGSQQVRDPEFQQRVVAETRALLATIPRLRGQA
jgi:NAD(P)-dependent dehydrogenase (short-subunit alcohol dehydrogenase family)